MTWEWRAISGPVLTAMVAFAIFFVDRRLVAIPDAASFYVAAVAISAAIGGTVAGLAGATVVIASTAQQLSLSGAPLLIGDNLVRLTAICVAALATAWAVGQLRSKWLNTLDRERSRRSELRRLSGALDEIDIGIVLLDADTRARFINRAFCHMFKLDTKQAASKLPFVALMYHGRDNFAYEMPEDELNLYISQRIAQVRRGDPTPVDIKLSSGEILRFRCTAMPDGGRMLTYVPITDLIRHSDNPTDRDRLLAQRTGHNTADQIAQQIANTLRAAE